MNVVTKTSENNKPQYVGRGGWRGGGRPKGATNKVLVSIKEAAQLLGPDCIKRLAELAGLSPVVPGDPSGAVQVAAIKELLDRGYGKATQPISADGEDGPMILEVVWKKPEPAAIEHVPTNCCVEVEPAE